MHVLYLKATAVFKMVAIAQHGIDPSSVEAKLICFKRSILSEYTAQEFYMPAS